jgi:hypothetical protein
MVACLYALQDRVAKSEESKRLLEGELETLRLATGKEEREKADILLAEKKARAQVGSREIMFVVYTCTMTSSNIKGFASWFKCPPLVYNSNKPL